MVTTVLTLLATLLTLIIFVVDCVLVSVVHGKIKDATDGVLTVQWGDAVRASSFQEFQTQAFFADIFSVSLFTPPFFKGLDGSRSPHRSSTRSLWNMRRYVLLLWISSPRSFRVLQVSSYYSLIVSVSYSYTDGLSASVSYAHAIPFFSFLSFHIAIAVAQRGSLLVPNKRRHEPGALIPEWGSPGRTNRMTRSPRTLTTSNELYLRTDIESTFEALYNSPLFSLHIGIDTRYAPRKHILYLPQPGISFVVHVHMHVYDMLQRPWMHDVARADSGDEIHIV